VSSEDIHLDKWFFSFLLVGRYGRHRVSNEDNVSRMVGIRFPIVSFHTPIPFGFCAIVL
jgi:hypothetical protein